MPNRLIHATSPYLLQHANNPVDWFEWGSDALKKATEENKPILVSIGYSACHWCHVMERECFENEKIATLMNDHFVCIKVDREERPDVDQVYMEAVQTMGVNGGWPLNVFLTPDQKPFYGGTYFPPENWSQVLLQISYVFRNKRKEVDESAAEITDHLGRSDLHRFAQQQDPGNINRAVLDGMHDALAARFDRQFGGMEKAPKFVMPTIWLFLLRYFRITGRNDALEMVSLTLRQMTRAGLYDQVGGGFARYSVDREWFAPHFEKMLYDNAQLLSLYAEMYAITKDDFYRKVISETVGWLDREMKHPNGAFYSALDADSEGSEGKFYIWTLDELKRVLGDDALDAFDYFGASEEGNWEHGSNILMRNKQSLPAAETLEMWKRKLLDARARRVRPGLDDKVLAGWNGMTIVGLLDAYRAIGDERYLELAREAMRFIEQNMFDGERLSRSFKGKRSSTEGFLEDYAFLIQAYLELYQADFDERWAHHAEEKCSYVIAQFYGETDGYFHFTSKSSEPLIARKKEIFDNVIPSSNSVMARNLFRLGTLLDKKEWKDMATGMVSALSSTMGKEPGYLSNWGLLAAEITHGLAEVVIIGPAWRKERDALASQYMPFAIFMGAASGGSLPLVSGKKMQDGKTTIYVCFNKVCRLPVTTVEEALLQLG